MRRQARPHMAVVANGFARRVGVELAGPECCLIPAGGDAKWECRESGFSFQFAFEIKGLETYDTYRGTVG